MSKQILRRTTLRWSSNGQLKSIDMKRILQLLANKELTQCALACDAHNGCSEIVFHLKDRL